MGVICRSQWVGVANAARSWLFPFWIGCRLFSTTSIRGCQMLTLTRAGTYTDYESIGIASSAKWDPLQLESSCEAMSGRHVPLK
jgi:hypothetical protein